MSVFKIHCVTLARPELSFFKKLEELFQEVCEYGEKRKFKTAAVHWWTSRPLHHRAHEPIVWLVASKAQSVIKKAYPSERIPRQIGGYTVWRDPVGVVSEIYLDHPANQNANNQAKLAFHELMHNKLQVGNKLHGSDYGFGLNKAMLNTNTAISARLVSENIKKMAPALSTKVKQWVPRFGAHGLQDPWFNPPQGLTTPPLKPVFWAKSWQKP